MKLTAVGLILVLLVAGLGGLFVWANKNHLDNLVKTYVLIKTKSLNRVSTATLIEGAIKGMVDALGDPYSVYLDRTAFQELNLQIEGAFGGIGVEIDLNKDKQLVVVAPLPGTPADRAGIKSGDIIAEINGKDTAQMSLIEAAGLLRGTPGSSVSLKIWRPQENRYFKVSLRRQQIQVPSVTGRMLPDHPGIGYLQVMQFNQMSTIPQLNRELARIEKAGYRGLILDLRGNPGGDLQTAVELASYFIKRGPVVRIVHRGGVEDVLQPVYSRRVKAPLVVLVNEGSASASEIVAGAIKDTKSGTLVGTRTFGKGLVQTVFNLDRNVGVKLTTDKYLTPNGHDINKRGIEPDVVVKQPGGTERDVQLEKGVQILEEQLGVAAEKAA
ncbi:MAG TPA: S41 family peptidase [Syntrophomonadaceae bacterium]|nr:S41 family peptidase [Syntrophomonadaceae bacterium]